MDKLLGHLAQFGSFIKQGELLCTQGLTYLLRDPEGDRVFAEWISSITGHPVPPGLRWRAELRQEDGGRPDLEGRSPGGRPVVKIEAKLGAPFGTGQLESYLASLCARREGGTLLIVVPKSRLNEIRRDAVEKLKIEDVEPWRVRRDAIEIPCAVATWEDLLGALDVVDSSDFQGDLGQFRAMYRVFNGDDMEPLTSDEQVLAWRDQKQWWEILVDQVSYFSIGTRDPFQDYKTPIWLRFHKVTGQFTEIVRRLDRSELRDDIVSSQGHTWLPLEVPLNSDRNAMVEALLKQVERILDIAYASKDG